MPAIFTSPLFLVLALWFAGLGAAAQFAKIAVIFPQLQDHYGLHGAQSGLMLSLVSFMGVILGLVAGIVAIRFGPRRVLLVSLAIGAAISLWQAILPSFPVMLASRIVEGFSHLGLVVATPTLIAGLTSGRLQNLALTLWGTFFSVAFAALAFLAPPLVAAHGIPSLFVAHGIYMAAFAALLAIALPQPRPPAPQPWPGLREIGRRHVAVYSSPFVSAPALGWTFYTLTFVSMITIMPPLFDEAIRPFATAAMPLAAIASSMTLGTFLLRRHSGISVVLMGFAAAILCSVGLLVAGPDPWLGIALFAALGLIQGASFAAVPQLNAGISERALANGGIAQTGNIGNMLGTPAGLAVVSVAGTNGLPVFLIACYGAAIAIHLYLARRRAAATD